MASGQDQIKPSLLAFHGSGSNATIHTVQLARLTRYLKPHFTIVSVEAPFPSAAGPGILPFFEGCGPYKRWIPASERLSIAAMKAGHASGELPAAVEATVRTAFEQVQRAGGKVAGLIGFSQGTRVVAGLAKSVEVLRAVRAAGGDGGGGAEWLDFGFALSVCGSYPPPLVPGSVVAALRTSGVPPERQAELLAARIALPALHVQGAQDEWAWSARLLIETSYALGGGRSEVLEFDMGHHYPVLPEDSEKVVDWALSTWARSEEQPKR